MTSSAAPRVDATGLAPQALEALFNPSAVAVIGASSTPGKIGHSVLANLLAMGFPGSILPVNPKGGEVQGLPAVADVNDLPQGLDLAVICIPRRFVVDNLAALAARGCKAVIVISAGFREVGRSGWELEEQLVTVARAHGMALLGPNCLGLVNTAAKLNVTFAQGRPEAGSIAFFSQSGALCVAILDWAGQDGAGLGFSKFVSLGNKACITERHMLEYLGRDEQTRVILGYIENVADGPAFLEAARAVSRAKPVVVLKSGTTASGARAASSHTGAIAGSEAAYAAAFRQSGVIRAWGVEELFNLARAFSCQPLPTGPNLAIVTNSGGPGILAADAAEKARLIMASLGPATIEKLKALLPAYAGLYNPIDIIGDADAARYRAALELVAADENVHALLVLLTPTASVEVEATAQAIADVAAASGKPVFACFMGRTTVAPGQRLLRQAGIPCYDFPEPAVASLAAMFAHAEERRRPHVLPAQVERDLEAAGRVLAEARRWGVREIVEFQAQDLLAAYRLPTAATRLARTSDAAVAAAAEVGYPVVLKIASAQISHKSDVGGVLVGLEDEAQVRAAFQEITARAQRLRPEAYISGCVVQAMAPKGSREVIVGFKRDDTFGPLVMFGLGGIHVEVLKDVSFRLAPLTRTDAQEMIREIRSYLLLKGLRGEPAVDFAALEDVILAMAQLAQDFPDIYEAEFNPVLVNSGGALVADVRLSLT